MAYYSDQDPIGGRFQQAPGARTDGPVCGAGELRSLLQNIAEHIAHADERQEATLREMQSRLVHIADEAQAVRAAIPPELAAAFARIEDGIEALTSHIGADDTAAPEPTRHTAWAEHFDGATQPSQLDADVRQEPPFRSQPEPYRPRGVMAAPPPLKSAAASSDYRWDRGSTPHPYADDHDGQWDQASAEALTRLYEPEQAAARHGLTGSQSPQTEPAASRPMSMAATGEQHDVDPKERAVGAWLEQRFGEIAARLEQSLASMRPESSVTVLEERLDAFEEKMGSAFDDLATRADIEKLKTVESHLTELARHIEQTRSQLRRLDDLESHLALLIEQISDDRFVRLLDQRVFSEPHVSRLAEAVAGRLVELEADRGEIPSGADRLGELRDLLERFVTSRRQGDDQTASALDTIQQAVLNLLDRMEALEQVQAFAQAAVHHGAAAADLGTGSGSDRGEEATRNFDLREDGLSTTISMRPSGQYARDLPAAMHEPAASETGGIGAELQQARAAVWAELPARIAAAASQDGVEGNPTKDAEATSPLPANRDDFLAAARRAARKASSQAAEEGAGLARPPTRARGAPRDRQGTTSRPVTGLVVATLAVVLAIGIGLTTYSIYKGDTRKPVSGAERSLPPPTTGADHSAADTNVEGDLPIAPAEGGDAAPANREAAAPGSTEENVPEVVIDDLPTTPSTPDVEDDNPRSRTVTGLPGGIMLDTGSVASPADIERIQRQRTLAQLSTRLGAAQAGTASIPAALIPQADEALPIASRERQSGQSNRIMPPAAVGPLSLRLAAANGDASAEFEVAVRLAEGRGVKQDLKEAVSWYQRSAARGFAAAQYRLGTLYERGLGVTADRGRAMAWYRSAAEKGNLKAMHNLAVLNASGDPANYRVAAHWFAEAASRGLADSQYNLAVLYETGRGVDRDLKKAYQWFAIAAHGGDKEAMRRRDRVKLMLDAKQLKAAEALVRSWKPVAVEPLANDTRAAGEAWKQREG